MSIYHAVFLMELRGGETGTTIRILIDVSRTLYTLYIYSIGAQIKYKFNYLYKKLVKIFTKHYCLEKVILLSDSIAEAEAQSNP